MSEIDINAPEVQNAIKTAVEEAVTGLKNKNTELLAERKKARKDSAIDPDDYNRLKEEKSTLEDQLAEAQKAIKASASEFEKLKKSHESEAGYVQKLLIDNGLSDAILKAGVKPELAKAAKALFAGQASIKIDGENRSAVIGDKSIDDYIKEWASSDEGKHFVAAPLNQGGGGNGGGGAGSGQKTISREQFNSKSQSERLEFAKSGGVVQD